MYKTTFVSAFVKIDGSVDYLNPQHKTLEKRIKYFEDIAKSGVPICLYLCKHTKPCVEPILHKYNNVKVIDYEYTSSILYRWSLDPSLEYPDHRNSDKDTREYMAFMHCKIEFMNHATYVNPWNTESFAWFDFSLGYIFRNKEASISKISAIAMKKWDGLFIPGCLPPLHDETLLCITQYIYWRFCGGVFIGNKESIHSFYAKYLQYYPIFLRTHAKIVWEVNFWAWLEFKQDAHWTPTWYPADHNDTILDVCDN